LPVLPRIFAVLAATLLVGSVALAALMPTDTTLVQALHAMDPAAPEHVQRVVTGLLGRGLWEGAIVPVMVRPVWLIPVCLGLICVGGAVSSLSHASPRTKQRRS
jgi:hypothetical protein